MPRMLNEYVIDSVRRYEGIGYTERFDTTPTGLRSQQTGKVYPAASFEADHVVALGEPADGVGPMLLFALRSRDEEVRGIWVVPREASLPREAQRLVQRLLEHDAQHAATRRLPLGRPRAADHVIDGGLAGLIGGSTVALWFLVVDTLAREPLFTPSLAGRAIFGRVAPASELPIDLLNVAMFTVLHGLLFIAFGIAVAWFVARHVERPRYPALFLALFVALEAGSVIAGELLLPELVRAVGHGAVLVGNALAAASMAVYLRWFQPHPADPRDAVAPRSVVTRLRRSAARQRAH